MHILVYIQSWQANVPINSCNHNSKHQFPNMILPCSSMISNMNNMSNKRKEDGMVFLVREDGRDEKAQPLEGYLEV